MKNNPKVSIIIPVYNGANYVKYAIDSALAQTYKNIEIIVVNDGSTDNTEEIVLSYGDKVAYFKKENGGVSTALNIGLEKMSGDYFSWLSHDDEYEKDKISCQIKELSKCDDRAILFSDYAIIDETGKRVDSMKLDHNLLEVYHEKALLNGMINGITLLIPRQAFDDCGNFNPDLRCTQDYDMWFRMLLKGYHFYHIDKSLAKSRTHVDQTTNTSPVMIKEGNELWIDMVKTYPLEAKIRMSGSEFNFYKEMAFFLNFQPYNKAKKYCIQQCYNIDKIKTKKLKKELISELKKRQKPRNYNPFILLKKLFSSLKNKGFKKTLMIIKRFVLGG